MSQIEREVELRMGITAVRRRLGAMRERVAETGVPLVIEKNGEPIAAMISLDDFHWLRERQNAPQNAETGSATFKDEPAPGPDLD